MASPEGERRRVQETRLKPNAPVLLLGEDYQLSHGVFVGALEPGDFSRDDRVATAQAVIRQQPVTDPTTWIADLKARKKRLFFDPAAARQRANLVEVESDYVSLANVELLNPPHSELIESTERFAADIKQREALGADIARLLPATSQQVDQALADLNAGQMTPKAYRIVEIRVGQYLNQLLKELGTTIDSKRTGFEYAIDVVRAVDQEIERRVKMIRDEISRIHEEKMTVQGKPKTDFMAHLKLTQLTGAMVALQNQQEALLDPAREIRSGALLCIGRLAAASQWYHETNPKTES